MQALQFDGFAGGLNTSEDVSALEPNELHEALNVRIGSKGEVQRRPGYDYWSADIPDPVEHMHRWREKDGTRNRLCVTLGGTVYVAKNDGFTFTVRGELGAGRHNRTNYPIGFAGGEDKLYVSTIRHRYVQSWDGISLHDVTNVHTSTSAAEDTDKDGNPVVYRVMPVGQHLVYRHGRMYVGRTTDNPSRVWFSNVLRPEAYGQNSWIDLDPEDGTTIQAMLSYADELFIFKHNSMWELTGRDPTTYSLRTVDKLRGTVSPKTVCQMRGLLVFFDRDTGLWGYDGSTLTLLSEKINEYLLKNQDYHRASIAAAYYGDDRLYLSVPWIDGTHRTFVMNVENGAWAEYDSGFAIGEYYLNDRYQSFWDKPGLLVANPDKDNIAGTEYYSHIKTGWFLPLGPGVKARIRRLEIIHRSRQGGEMDVELYRDMSRHVHMTRMFQTLEDDIDIKAGLSEFHTLHNTTLDGWGGRLHSMQLDFGFRYLPMQLHKFTVFVTGGEDLRGERR